MAVQWLAAKETGAPLGPVASAVMSAPQVTVGGVVSEGGGGGGARSWMKTSPKPLVSPTTKLEALESKATKRPSALMAGSELELFPWPPALETLTLVVLPVWRSWTKTSRWPLVSPVTRLEAGE